MVDSRKELNERKNDRWRIKDRNQNKQEYLMKVQRSGVYREKQENKRAKQGREKGK